MQNSMKNMVNQANPRLIDPDSQILKDKLYIYGTDKMSNDDIKAYFLHYPQIKLQWINDSSVVLSFDSEEQAADAFFKMRVKPLDQS